MKLILRQITLPNLWQNEQLKFICPAKQYAYGISEMSLRLSTVSFVMLLRFKQTAPLVANQIVDIQQNL